MSLRVRGYVCEGSAFDKSEAAAMATNHSRDIFNAVKRHSSRFRWVQSGPTKASGKYRTDMKAKKKDGSIMTLEVVEDPLRNHVSVVFSTTVPRMRSNVFMGKMSSFLSSLKKHLGFLPVGME